MKARLKLLKNNLNKTQCVCFQFSNYFTTVKPRSTDTIIKEFYGLIRPYLLKTVAK